MSMRSKRGRGLILGAVNVAVVLGAALIINSQAATDTAPSSSSSFVIPDKPEFAFAQSNVPRASATSAAAPAKGPSDRSASAAGPSISSVPTTDTPAIEGEPILDHLWYAEASSPSATFPSLLDDASSWSEPGGSPVTSWGTPAPAALGGSSSSRGRYAGGFGGGGSSSGGGGAGGGQSNSRTGSTDPAATAAGLRRTSDGTTSALAGSGSAFGSPQASANLPQGNLFGGGVNTPTGLAFPLVQFPGNGAGAVPPGFASANLKTQTTQSTVTTLQTPVSVPEPTSVLLFGTALTLGVAYRRRHRPRK